MPTGLRIFWRLMVVPLAREPVRTALAIFSVALGVAVVLAIDLAGQAATGSFHSSLETLSGKQNFEITATGGVPEDVVGKLATQPFDWRITARMEDFAVLPDMKKTLPLIGIDLIGEANELSLDSAMKVKAGSPRDVLSDLASPNSIWVGESLGKGRGDSLELLINDRSAIYTICGTYPDAGGNESAIVMDIATAQSELGRAGRVDRIYIRVPENEASGSRGPLVALNEWQTRLEQLLPQGLQLRAAGASTEDNRKMLAAFRWNLKLLSYIALIVGAFLIYNTISVSVVRRRAEIGIARALGASRFQVLSAFLMETALIGVTGSVLGIPLGRLLASWAVKLMGTTVSALYVSSRPGTIALAPSSAILALLIGAALTLCSAWFPAREAAQVAPIEAMARGRREFLVRVSQTSSLSFAIAAAALALVLSLLSPVNGKPVFGYCAALCAVIAAALAIPSFVEFTMRLAEQLLSKMLAVEGLLASRSLTGSLRRTSVLVAALCTAVAMMTAVTIMVGSFRQTVVSWMDSSLPADLYLRPAGSPAADQHPTISPQLSDAIGKLPGVRAAQRLRAYEITYQGMPATLGSLDLHDAHNDRQTAFLSGRAPGAVLDELRGASAVIISEPFSYKHHVVRGGTIQLQLGGARRDFRVADVYYDYASERGVILMDRSVLLRDLPDPAPSNIAVFVSPTSNVAAVRREIEQAAEQQHARLLVFDNRDLRSQAVQIFDRTFAITYALQAVAILVAVMGVAGALLALVIDRRRELGLLRYLGATGAQLRKIILAEAGLLGTLGCLSGLLLGFFLSLILIFVINKQSFGWTIRLHWPFALLAGAIALIWCATVLAAYYPARIAVRLNPMEVVREE